MALFRRGKWWWADFSVNGVRYRQPIRSEKGQRTKDWREALSREKELIAEAQAGKLSLAGRSFGRLAFTEALGRYLADRSAHVTPRSKRTESDHAKPLRESFGAMPLTRISAEAIVAYIRHRKEKGISNVTINMEIGILRRVLKRGKRWSLIADEVPRLPERRDIGRALTLEDKMRLLRTAAAKPEWDTARLAAILALNTTMRGCELKGLHWRDVDWIERTITIQRSSTKTDAGGRIIPLNTDAWHVILSLRDRAKALFGNDLQPDWYVFPHAEGYSKPDPTLPMTGWRSAWRSLTRAINCPACGQLQQPSETRAGEECRADISKAKSPLHGFRFHDLRHHAITELCESQSSERTIMSIAGHISPRMLEHYSHIRLAAKRKALDSISGGSLMGGYDTKDDTKPHSQRIPSSHVLEKVGGDDETRTRDLCRDRAAF
jgi:integrase